MSITLTNQKTGALVYLFPNALHELSRWQTEGAQKVLKGSGPAGTEGPQTWQGFPVTLTPDKFGGVKIALA